MGIIVKQSIKGSIWSYAGVVIGFITTTYLFTRYLTPDIVGLFGLLVSISTITAGLSSLGMNGVTSRLFPYFRNNDTGHNGYFLTAIIPQLVGFGLFLLIFALFRGRIIATNLEKSPLFARYVYLTIPLTFFFSLFNFLDTYNKLLYNTVLGTFLQEFLQRIMISIVVILYIIKLISLNQLIIGYAIAVSIKSIIIFSYLLKEKKISFRVDFKFITRKLRKEIVSVALFSIIGGLGSMIVFNIDKIVVNQLIDLKNTGIYTIAFYFGTLVVIPSRPLLRISGTLVADAWAKNNLAKVRTIYYKSCINQLIIGGFLFLGIWANINNILILLGPDYEQSKWVIFFIGLGYLFDMMTGANGLVISYSKYYRVSLWFILILVVLVTTFLYTLIPLWGITGAAIAIALALFLNNLMRYLFLVRKFRLQPFNYKFAIIILFYTGLYFLAKLIPQQHLILDLFLRNSVIILLTCLFVCFVPVSKDILAIRNSLVSRLRKKNLRSQNHSPNRGRK